MTTTQQELESRLWKAANALRRPLSQIVEDAPRLDVTKIAPDIVFAVDSIVVEVAYSGWKGPTPATRRSAASCEMR